MQLEEAAEGRWAHACQAGQFGQTQVVTIVGCYVVLHFQHAARVALHVNLGIAAGSQRAGTVLAREFVEYGHELHHGIEPVLYLAEPHNERIDVHNGRHGETKPLTRLLHHVENAAEGVSAKDAVLGDVEVELYGDFVNIGTGALMLLPHMLKVGRGNEHEVVVVDNFRRVTHNAPNALGILHEVQLIDVVVVYGVIELLLVTVGNVENVASAQGRYFVNDFHVELGVRSVLRSLYLQFLHDFTHLLQGGDARWNERQAQHILDEAHFVEHGLDASRVTINEEQREEVSKAVVNLACSIVLTTELQADHLGELLGQGVANNANHAHGTTADHGEGERIIATDDIEVLWLVLDDFIYLLQIARRLLDGHDVTAVACQPDGSLCLHINACTARHVVEHNGQFGGCGYGAEMLVESLLRRLIIIRTDAEHAVDALEVARLQLLNDGGRVVAATPHEDGHTCLHEVNDGVLDAQLLVGCQRRGFTRSCQYAEKVGPIVKLVVDQTDKRGVVNLSVGLEGRNKCYAEALEYILYHIYVYSDLNKSLMPPMLPMRLVAS